MVKQTEMVKIVSDLQKFPPRKLISFLEQYYSNYLEELAKSILSHKDQLISAKMPSMIDSSVYNLLAQTKTVDGILRLTCNDIPSDVKKVKIEDPHSSVSELANNFLSFCNLLTYVDLTDLKNVVTIGNRFLSGSSSLKELLMSSFDRVTKIGNYFLYSCTSLEHVDLSPFVNVIKIENHFLSGCTSLMNINVSGLTGVTSIKNSFLSECTNLTSLDFSRSLTKLVEIGDGFLFNCSSLGSLDLTGLTNVEKIGAMFLSGCVSLRNVTVNTENSGILLVYLLEALEQLRKPVLIQEIEKVLVKKLLKERVKTQITTLEEEKETIPILAREQLERELILSELKDIEEIIRERGYRAALAEHEGIMRKRRSRSDLGDLSD